MKLTLKVIALLIVLLGASSNLASDVPDKLDPWYRAYNATLFDNELPNWVLIGHDLHDDRFMAVTDTVETAQGIIFRIEFNPKYGPSPKQERLTLLHEMCHIREDVEHEISLDIHGPMWESCMHKVADEKGFDLLW